MVLHHNSLRENRVELGLNFEIKARQNRSKHQLHYKKSNNRGGRGYNGNP